MKRHDIDLTALLAGLIFCGIAVAYLVGQSVNRSLEPRWVLPILLIGLGGAGLAGTLVHARRGSPAMPDAEMPPADPTPPAPGSD